MRAGPSKERPRRSVLLRVRVALSRCMLDRLLAGGADPDATSELSLRTAQLQRRSARGRIASALEGVLARAAAAGPEPGLSAGPSLQRGEVLAAAPVLRRLAERLRGEEVPEPAGVVLARRLLVDGLGPVYAASAPGRLWDCAEEALVALERPGPRPDPAEDPDIQGTALGYVWRAGGHAHELFVPWGTVHTRRVAEVYRDGGTRLCPPHPAPTATP